MHLLTYKEIPVGYFSVVNVLCFVTACVSVRQVTVLIAHW